MNGFFLKVYDYVSTHKGIGRTVMVLLMALCVILTLRLDYKEEITDFLPVDEHYLQSMRIYQEVASANKVVLQFSSEAGADSIITAVNEFGKLLPAHDTLGWIAGYEPQIDVAQVLDVAEFVYSHLPYMLDEEDYARADSLMQDPDYAKRRLVWIREQLSGMSGSFMMPMLQNDPLGLGDRIASHMRDFQPQTDYLKHDGYVFTPDGRCCLVTLDSPFGSSESMQNGRLVQMLQDVADELGSEHVTVSMTGAPVIAAGNASRIRKDTILSVAVSVVLILLLLLWAFRSVRALLYIALSTGMGFLIALAGVSLVNGEISLIVVGIASIIIGIAVNYPLHFVCHGQEVGVHHAQDRNRGRMVLSDLVQPLLIGNVTTVAAFLTLVPLEAVAIRQLGLFSALMLVGTIMFVLLVMPHMKVCGVSSGIVADGAVQSSAGQKMGLVLDRIVVHPMSLAVIVLLTIVFGWFSLQTVFDADVSHLNYMTSQQRSDMKRLSQMQGQADGVVVYVPSTLRQMEQMQATIETLKTSGIVTDEKNPVWFMASVERQEHRLALWRGFWQKHDYLSFLSESRDQGFSEEAFEPFQLLIESDLPLLTYDDYATLTGSLLTGFCSPEAVVARLTVADLESAQKVEAALSGSFDLTSLNSQIANNLTADFNYIGFACALIVFMFLWISFRRIELALVAFTPMVVGWLWILGLMHLTGVQFNIVNIILATFIFGQGDDYTIFITEGLIRDYRQGSGHRVLVGYQRSILLSAAIMLVGIGSLILAGHPAMHSLAEVTIVGMSVVVLMAWLLPPMMFHWLIRFDRPLREWLEKSDRGGVV